ncbi:AlpA family phage regulatory protein [Aurantiacibacter suaedae]|uniref:AlpA family phage regulatory protein n=1 Tax=Aurantiacibacter suaedae TaxID=2545755 RepID=UPI001F4FCC47|nr:AlpA family phage regulatory protein [Aurantiacibacter suaedae]
MRRTEIECETGLTCSAIYRLMEEGTFPRPRRIDARTASWESSEIEAWEIGLIENGTLRKINRNQAPFHPCHAHHSHQFSAKVDDLIRQAFARLMLDHFEFGNRLVDRIALMA